MSRQLTLQIHPGRALGFIALGSSLHEILSRLKSQPHLFPSIEIFYSPTDPLSEPVILNLPRNGFRLRFDGPVQRLRLIEVHDFSHTRFIYDGKDVVKLGPEGATTKGPAFRQIYDRLIGPTFPGEYIPPNSDSQSGTGSYVLSYPGVAFTFPLSSPMGTITRDFVSLLSSSQAGPAKSMALFDGESWKATRKNLYSRPCPTCRSSTAPNRVKDLRPDEIDYVIIKESGHLEIHRLNSAPFRVTLSSTTPQDLVTELGPPDAVYRKSDKMAIHKSRRNRKSGASGSGYEDATDTDHSSHAVTDESGEEDEGYSNSHRSVDAEVECFWNYFNHGIDVLVSYPAQPLVETNQLVVTKVLLHGNIPGSYPFNRYRRCRWKIDPQRVDGSEELTSETPYSTVSSSLQQIIQDNDTNEELPSNFQQAMVLNRRWDNSPGSSCELLGGWEESDQTAKGKNVPSSEDGPGLGNTELFGFPGLVFEVLKNDCVSCLMAY